MAARKDGRFRIMYAGAFCGGAGLLVEALRGGALGEEWTLELYGASPGHVESLGWQDARITAHGWGSQAEVHAAMTEADLLYAPNGFDAESQRLAVRQFPSKVADYLAARKPILVCAPANSSIARYVHRWNCAELVEEESAEAVGAALRRLAESPERRRELIARGDEAFRANHDVKRQREDLLTLLRGLRDRSRCGARG